MVKADPPLWMEQVGKGLNLCMVVRAYPIGSPRSTRAAQKKVE